MPIHFCTYFDHNYLPRGLALYYSLCQHCPAFRLWVLCLNQECYDELRRRALPNIMLIRLDELERAYPELLAVKHSRTRIEYYFTCTPLLPLYVLEQASEIAFITYLDADTFLFADPTPVVAELSAYSIAITEHRYPPYLRAEMDPYGLYNVGWLSFRRDEQGLGCLKLWAQQCLEWCYDRLEGERYADQKYLDRWPALFDQLLIIKHKGINAAPWNFMNHCIEKRGAAVYIDDDPLILFHFHGFKQKSFWLYDTHSARYGAVPTRAMRHYVFEPYIRKLKKLLPRKQLLGRGIRYQADFRFSWQPILFLRKTRDFAKSVASGQQLIFIGGRIVPLLLLLLECIRDPMRVLVPAFAPML